MIRNHRICRNSKRDKSKYTSIVKYLIENSSLKHTLKNSDKFTYFKTLFFLQKTKTTKKVINIFILSLCMDFMSYVSKFTQLRTRFFVDFEFSKLLAGSKISLLHIKICMYVRYIMKTEVHYQFGKLFLILFYGN